MKTTENPETKTTDPHTARDFDTEVRCAVALAPATPVMYERYHGTKGRTQGERNDTRPAANASGIANSNEPEVTVSTISLIGITFRFPKLRSEQLVTLTQLLVQEFALPPCLWNPK